jgi:hypothetical protein
VRKKTLNPEEYEAFAFVLTGQAPEAMVVA